MRRGEIFLLVVVSAKFDERDPVIGCACLGASEMWASVSVCATGKRRVGRKLCTYLKRRVIAKTIIVTGRLTGSLWARTA